VIIRADPVEESHAQIPLVAQHHERLLGLVDGGGMNDSPKRIFFIHEPLYLDAASVQTPFQLRRFHGESSGVSRQ
jgi:hypothetical protein